VATSTNSSSTAGKAMGTLSPVTPADAGPSSGWVPSARGSPILDRRPR
jgi:hypothetical protein